MPYYSKDIDRAIVMTQWDLRGFSHPLGVRIKPITAKSLVAITFNLPALIAGASRKTKLDKTYVSPLKGELAYEPYVVMAKVMADACDLSQAEAIDLILRKIIREMNRLRKQCEVGEHKHTSYISELNKDSAWGRIILAMREGFAEKFKAVRESYC